MWRTNEAGEVEVLLVYRLRRTDWSLPKGKLNRGETAVVAALREVREETGLRCELGARLPSTRYVDRKGRDKQVSYWAMQASAGRFRRNREVHEARWVTIEVAATMLTYDWDITVVAALRDLLVTVG